jgi:hypothetical protein
MAARGPNHPGVTTPDASDTGVDDPGPAGAASASSKSKSKHGSSKSGRKHEVKSKNSPAQPDLKKALERLLRGGGSKPAPTPKLPNVTTPSLPSAPTPPNVTAGATGGRSPDPQALLDYLMSP